MASRSLVVFAFAFGAIAAADAAAPRSEPSVPLRIASLNLAADEVLIDLVPHERIVAVTGFVDQKGTSNALGRVPKSIARFPKSDLERLIALRPDLVVVSQYTDADFLKALERSGLRAYRMTGLDSIAGFRQAILDLGHEVGAETRAREIVARFDERLAAVRAGLEGAARPTVLYWASGFTSGANTPFGSLIECGGGRNAAALAGIAGVVPIGSERAFAMRPDWLLVGEGTTTARELRSDPLLGRLDAVARNRIVEMPTDILVALNHHAATACEFLARRLHPGRFR